MNETFEFRIDLRGIFVVEIKYLKSIRVTAAFVSVQYDIRLITVI